MCDQLPKANFQITMKLTMRFSVRPRHIWKLKGISIKSCFLTERSENALNKWSSIVPLGKVYRTLNNVIQEPEKKTFLGCSLLYRIYRSNLCLPFPAALNSETDFPKYIFNRLTLFDLYEKLRGDLEEEWVNQFFNSRNVMPSPNCSHILHLISFPPSFA